MLKLYVDTMIYLNHSTETLARQLKEKSDEGFVSAETIALAVAGVLIVGGIFTVFRDRLKDSIDPLFDRIDNFTN